MILDIYVKDRGVTGSIKVDPTADVRLTEKFAQERRFRLETVRFQAYQEGGKIEVSPGIMEGSTEKKDGKLGLQKTIAHVVKEDLPQEILDAMHAAAEETFGERLRLKLDEG